MAVNLGRKGDQSGDYSILQLRINPVEVPTEALERNDYLLPLDALLQPLDGEIVTVNDLAAGTLEIIETYGPPLDGEGDDFHFNSTWRYCRRAWRRPRRRRHFRIYRRPRPGPRYKRSKTNELSS